MVRDSKNMASSSSDPILCALDELNQQLQIEILPVGRDEQRDHMHCTVYCSLLLTAFARVFVQENVTETAEEEEVEEEVVVEEELTRVALLSRIDSLKIEWGFHRLFLKYIHEWTDADKIYQNLGSLFLQIEAAADEIKRDLSIASKRKYVAKKPSKLSQVLRDSLKKFDHFRPEIQDGLDCLSGGSRSVNLQHQFSWTRFIASIEENLEVISGNIVHYPDLAEQISSFRNKLTLLKSFLGRVTESLNNEYPREQSVNDFFTHVTSVAIRMANQSCVYWFREMDSDTRKITIAGIQDLQEEIDPVAPLFLELNVQFLKVMNKARSVQVQNRVNLFLDYLLGGKWGHSHFWELKTLVGSVVNKQEGSTEDKKSLLADLSALLREFLPIRDVLFSGNFFHPFYHMYETKHWFLKQRISLLETEIFLKEQVSSSTAFMQDAFFFISRHTMELKMLRAFSPHILDEELKNEKQILTALEDVFREVDSIYQSFQANEITGSKVKNSFRMILLRVILLKAGLYLMELLTSNASVVAFGRDKMEKLHEGLKLLKFFVKHYPVENKEGMELIFTRIQMVAGGISSLYYTVVANKLTETTMERMILSFSDLLDKVNLIKTKLREICQQFPRSSSPKTDGLGFISFLLGNLEELLNCNPDSIAPVKHYINDIRLDLCSLRDLLMELDTEHPKWKDVGKTVVDIGYEMEYAIDSIEVGNGSNWKHFLCLYYLLEDIRLIKMQATKIYEEERTSNDSRVHNAAHSSSHLMSQSSKLKVDARVESAAQSSNHTLSEANRLQVDKLLVPLKDQEEAIINRLRRGSKQRDIVPIVGMPGIGKTTLAKKVYNDPQVTYHFHIRAWCSVSQEYEKRELLLEILSNINALNDSNHEMTVEDLELKLYRQLRQNVYLIVMDDVWNVAAWTDLESSLPDDGNGSRVLITSRLHDMTAKAKPDIVPHPLRLLSVGESWKLLQMKIFHESGCPDELLEVGKRIAENCKGLPLAIVAIAGILKRTEEKQNKWKEVADNLSSLIVNDPEARCKEILQLSYKHLPVYLRTCFLYLGAFQEDKDILIRKLIWLWIAEGFVHKTELKSLEDAAEDCLMDLIDCSLVIISKMRSNGKGKACRVHDMLRELCLSKAKEENFFQLITRFDKPYASFDDSDYGFAFDDYFPSNHKAYEVHRLSFFLKRKHFALSRPSGQSTRSLIFFATSDTYPRCPYDVSFISHHFKLLRVLDVECINMGLNFPAGIELLVQLRYLAVSGDIDTVPPSIANLWKLETFVVKGLKGKVILPDTIWCMARLRHLHVNNHAAFSWQDDKLGHSLDNLVTLSSPSFSYGEKTERIIRQLPNLHQLRCIFSESWDSSTNCNQFPGLSFLSQLESLRIFYSGRALNPGELNFPSSLNKLTLSNFRLPWSSISAIGRLENLEVLKLLPRAFEGPRWDMTEGEFLKLKFLKLDTLNIVEWNATNYHLPNLHHLVLRSCKDLKEVPLAFGEISTLEIIEVQWCGQSTEESVKNIKDEEIEGLNIVISNSHPYV